MSSRISANVWVQSKPTIDVTTFESAGKQYVNVELKGGSHIDEYHFEVAILIENKEQAQAFIDAFHDAKLLFE